MESIAQETVEFLYEENGGIPKDLRLPTMDDVKAELGKFTISRVRKGSAVVVQRELPYARCGVRTMQKTQSLTGIVLDVDEVSGEERGGEGRKGEERGGGVHTGIVVCYQHIH